MVQDGKMPRKAAVRNGGKVDNAGQLPIPEKLRETMDGKSGGSGATTAGRSRSLLEARSAAVRAAQNYFRTLAPESEVWSDELIAERAPGGAAGTCELKTLGYEGSRP